jgi:hypothetical protein
LYLCKLFHGHLLVFQASIEHDSWTFTFENVQKLTSKTHAPWKSMKPKVQKESKLSCSYLHHLFNEQLKVIPQANCLVWFNNLYFEKIPTWQVKQHKHLKSNGQSLSNKPNLLLSWYPPLTQLPTRKVFQAIIHCGKQCVLPKN